MAYTLDPALPQADIHMIKRMIPHRYPFLMIDRVANIEVNRFAIGIKNVTVNEPHFEGHFPVRPVMPGVLIIEAMAQTSAVPNPTAAPASPQAAQQPAAVEVLGHAP